jgi:hypothetical protein
MTTSHAQITDRTLRAWLQAGAVDRGIGDGLTFMASAVSARAGKASWILRYRLKGRSKKKVLGRFPALGLKDARDLARQDREQIERGIDVAAVKQAEKLLTQDVPADRAAPGRGVAGPVHRAPLQAPRGGGSAAATSRRPSAGCDGARRRQAPARGRAAVTHRGQWRSHDGQRCPAVPEPDVPDGRAQPVGGAQSGSRLRQAGRRRRRSAAGPLACNGFARPRFSRSAARKCFPPVVSSVVAWAFSAPTDRPTLARTH